MATIRKRNRTYQVQVRKRGLHQSRTFNNFEDAKKWAVFTENKFNLGDEFRVVDKNLSLSDLIKRYLSEITPTKRGWESEKRRLKRLLRDPLSKQLIKKLQTYDFIKFRDRRMHDGSRTCIYDLVLLSHIYNVAMKQWDIPIKNNPLKNVKKPKYNKPRERRLTKNEYNLLVKGNYPQATLRSIIELAFETGMRRNELLSILPEHIKGQTLSIPVTKNGDARTIPLTKRALCILKNAQLPFPMSANAVRLAWDRLKKKRNIKDLLFHDLRHEAISRFFEKGLSIPEVALISGHKDVRMLFRYTHLKAEDILRKL